jgi:hypothetical protein
VYKQTVCWFQSFPQDLAELGSSVWLCTRLLGALEQQVWFWWRAQHSPARCPRYWQSNGLLEITINALLFLPYLASNVGQEASLITVAGLAVVVAIVDV